MIVVIDIGIGNLGSIVNMLRAIGAPGMASKDAADLAAAERLILPGVGAFDAGVRRLRQSGLVDILRQRVLGDRVPVLGICLGMQLLGEGSEEGSLPGLGWLAADTVRFDFATIDDRPRIPHMGWNTVEVRRGDSLFRDADDRARYYFVHSYHLRCRNSSDVLGTTHHGYDFASAVQCDNIYGTQFHPEKSHGYGKAVLRAFAES
jgi:glutamine amidotransferase